MISELLGPSMDSTELIKMMNQGDIFYGTTTFFAPYGWAAYKRK